MKISDIEKKFEQLIDSFKNSNSFSKEFIVDELSSLLKKIPNSVSEKAEKLHSKISETLKQLTQDDELTFNDAIKYLQKGYVIRCRTWDDLYIKHVESIEIKADDLSPVYIEDTVCLFDESGQLIAVDYSFKYHEVTSSWEVLIYDKNTDKK